VGRGFGYTVTAASIYFPPSDTVHPDHSKCSEGLFSCIAPKKGICNVRKTQAGIPKLVDIGLTDPVKANLTRDNSDPTKNNPFFIRIGICYTKSDGSHAADKEGLLTITRGYRSWGGGGVEPSDQELRKFWNQLINRVPGQICDGLDAQRVADNMAGCPGDGVIPVPDSGAADGGCPAPSVRGDGANETTVCSREAAPLARLGISECCVLKPPRAIPTETRCSTSIITTKRAGCCSST